MLDSAVLFDQRHGLYNGSPCLVVQYRLTKLSDTYSISYLILLPLPLSRYRSIADFIVDVIIDDIVDWGRLTVS